MAQFDFSIDALDLSTRTTIEAKTEAEARTKIRSRLTPAQNDVAEIECHTPYGDIREEDGH